MGEKRKSWFAFRPTVRQVLGSKCKGCPQQSLDKKAKQYNLLKKQVAAFESCLLLVALRQRLHMTSLNPKHETSMWNLSQSWLERVTALNLLSLRNDSHMSRWFMSVLWLSSSPGTKQTELKLSIVDLKMSPWPVPYRSGLGPLVITANVKWNSCLQSSGSGASGR